MQIQEKAAGISSDAKWSDIQSALDDIDTYDANLSTQMSIVRQFGAVCEDQSTELLADVEAAATNAANAALPLRNALCSYFGYGSSCHYGGADDCTDLAYPTCLSSMCCGPVPESCAPNNLTDAFQEFASRPPPSGHTGPWPYIFLYVFKTQFSIASRQVESSTLPDVSTYPDVEVVKNCKLSPEQVLDGSMWTTAITVTLSGNVTDTVVDGFKFAPEGTFYTIEFVFDIYDIASARKASSRNGEIYFDSTGFWYATNDPFPNYNSNFWYNFFVQYEPYPNPPTVENVNKKSRKTWGQYLTNKVGTYSFEDELIGSRKNMKNNWFPEEDE